jgi:hypothetical protein
MDHTDTRTCESLHVKMWTSRPHEEDWLYS